MELTHLGHAMWLIDAAGLRLLFDPLLGETHHGGVYAVRPRRAIDEEALRADFVLVSHRHTDHFDLPSLARLAELDPESVVLTPDALVAWAAQALGFAQVHTIGVGHRLELDAVRLVTTPSTLADEWGVLVEEEGGALAWNQVDTGFRDAKELRGAMARAMAALDRDEATGPDLAIVRWQPMLEIEAQTCGRLGFPHRLYRGVLDQVRALNAKAIVPGACGAGRVGPFAWMDAHAYPVSEARFLADVRAMLPRTASFPARIGAVYEVSAERVCLIEEPPFPLARALEPAPPIHPAAYAPFSIPPLTDPELGRAPDEAMRARVTAWVEGALANGIAAAWPSMQAGPLRLALDVVFASATDRYTIHVGQGGARVTRDHDAEWDAYNAVAGSLLFEVLEGRFAWGDVLLGGMLRACDRSYRVDEAGLSRARVGIVFLYYALSYDEAFERAIRFQVGEILAARAA